MSAPLSPTLRFYLTLAPWVVVGAILIGVLIKWFGYHFERGLMFGTLYAHLGIAALLASWGPGSLGQRVAASLGILSLVLGAIGAHTFYSDHLYFLLLITFCALVQYFLMAGFYALLRLRYGLRLQHHSSPTRNIAPSDRQFGIGQLIILMTAVAVCLALVRAVLSGVNHDTLVLPFLSVVATLTLGLLSITLLLKRTVAFWAVPLMLVFMVVLTNFELPLMWMFLRGYLPDELHFVWLNTFSVAWTMFYILLIRVTGYQLAAPPLEPQG
ncbi:MAG: hypothetical protein ACO1RA_21465 [Planctomycetaceae bacterium]